MDEYVVMARGTEISALRTAGNDITDFRLEDHIDVPTDVVADVIELALSPDGLDLTTAAQEDHQPEPEQTGTADGNGSTAMFEFEFLARPPAGDTDGPDRVERDKEHCGVPASALYWHLHPVIWTDPAKEMKRTKRTGSSRNRKFDNET